MNNKNKNDMRNGLVAFIRPNSWFKSTLVPHGTHNGYVAVPPCNKYHGMSYWDMEDIDVHGGITFSEPAISGEESIGSKRKINPKYVGKRNPILDDVEFITDDTEIGDDWWIFGFDTFHLDDNGYEWDRSAVIQETFHLMSQLDKS